MWIRAHFYHTLSRRPFFPLIHITIWIFFFIWPQFYPLIHMKMVLWMRANSTSIVSIVFNFHPVCSFANVFTLFEWSKLNLPSISHILDSRVALVNFDHNFDAIYSRAMSIVLFHRRWIKSSFGFFGDVLICFPLDVLVFADRRTFCWSCGRESKYFGVHTIWFSY